MGFKEKIVIIPLALCAIAILALGSITQRVIILFLALLVAKNYDFVE